MKGIGSPGRIRTSNISVINSLLLDLITIVPEPRQIEGNQQDLEPGVRNTLGPIAFTGKGRLFKRASRIRKSVSSIPVSVLPFNYLFQLAMPGGANRGLCRDSAA
jgi:hypothetical protein